MKSLTVAQSFALGWNYGRLTGQILTNREAEERYPDADAVAVVEGSIDGVKNDRFRLNG